MMPFDIDGARPALFLDIDGTLLEHQPRPDGLVVDAALRDLLLAAEDRLEGALAFVTGRSVAMVDDLFAPLALPVAGLYGLEHRLERDGPVEAADEPADVRAVAEALQTEFHDTQGVYFERKGPVLAIHTREAPEALGAVRAAAERVLGSLPSGYRIVLGHAGLEFMPVDALKSGAILRFMSIAPFAGRRPVFVGDDVSDECGFECVNEMGGLSVKVGLGGDTSAALRLADVAAVRRFLAEDVLGIEGRPGGPA